MLIGEEGGNLMTGEARALIGAGPVIRQKVFENKIFCMKCLIEKGFIALPAKTQSHSFFKV